MLPNPGVPKPFAAATVRPTHVKPRRPDFNQAVRALLEHACGTIEGFGHIRPEQLLVVAGEARRASRGTIKPLTFAGGKRKDKLGRRKPVVRVGGVRMLYCITLRPLFFRDSTPHARVGTLLHELFHIATAFDGTLHPARRHAKLGKRFGGLLRPIVKRYLETIPPELLAPFAFRGEVEILQWLERPGPAVGPGERLKRSVYTEAQLYMGAELMVTKRAKKRAVKLRKRSALH